MSLYSIMPEILVKQHFSSQYTVADMKFYVDRLFTLA